MLIFVYPPTFLNVFFPHISAFSRHCVILFPLGQPSVTSSHRFPPMASSLQFLFFLQSCSPRCVPIVIYCHFFPYRFLPLASLLTVHCTHFSGEASSFLLYLSLLWLAANENWSDFPILEALPPLSISILATVLRSSTNSPMIFHR